MKKSSETVAISSNGISKKSRHAQRISRKNQQTTTRKQLQTNLQDTDVTANKGYDLFCSMSNSAFQLFIGELLPDSFDMPITLDNVKTNYNIALLPITSKSAAQIVDASNNVSIAVPFSASPTTSGVGADSFTGTTTLEFDISKMVLNGFRKSNMLTLDGTSGGYVSSTSNSTSISTVNGFAYEAWVRLSSGITGSPVICSHSGSDGLTWLAYSVGNKFLTFRAAGNLFYSEKLDNLEDGNWHHVAVSISNRVGSFYVDGVLKGTTTSITSNSYAATQIGISNTASGSVSAFDGDITDVRMWSIPRSQSAIQRYMNVDMQTLESYPSGLFQLWKFNGNQSKPVNLINTNNVGTIHGTADVNQPPSADKHYMVNWLSTSDVFQTPST
ncbi:MAG: LamG domain-containing protein [Bacteroidota bacterium]